MMKQMSLTIYGMMTLMPFHHRQKKKMLNLLKLQTISLVMTRLVVTLLLTHLALILPTHYLMQICKPM